MSFPLEVFQPKTQVPRPLILMLHGSAGAYSIRASPTSGPLDNFGEHRLASECFVVVLPHYFEAFGVKSMTSEADILSHAIELQSIIKESLNVALRLPSVDHKRVGVYGESLGGFLAVRLVSGDTRIQVISAIGTAEPPDLKITNHNWKALLLQHGISDSLVPIIAAKQLANDAAASGVRVEWIPYFEEDHYLSPAARKAVLEHTVKFFHEYFGYSQ